MWFNLQYLLESQVIVTFKCVIMVCTICGGENKFLKCENEHMFAHNFLHFLSPHDQWLDGINPPWKHYKLDSPILKHQYHIVDTT